MCSETYICNVVGIFVHGYVSSHVKLCIPVLLVTLLTAVNSYEKKNIYTDIVLSYLHMKLYVYVTFMSYLRGIFVSGTYIVIAW